MMAFAFYAGAFLLAFVCAVAGDETAALDLSIENETERYGAGGRA